MHPFLALISTFSEDNKVRGTQFEKLCKWYLQTDPLYAAKLEEVWLWDEWPGRWGADCGIDLVARDTEGKVWAIQAKCYAAHNSVTKQDIDSFLSESINPKIDNRLLIATTDGLAPNAVKVIKRQNEVVPVHQSMLTNLLDASVEWPLSLDDLSTGKVKQPYTPKPYQQTAINEVVSKLDNRGQLIMACGTGKTLTALWIDEAVNTNTTLVLLPSLLLLSKTLSEWLTHSKERFAFLPVCSDESIGSGLDSIDFSTSELSFPVTTDSAEIAAFLKKPQKKVIFSTYQSSAKVAEAFKSASLPHIDLIIADEAHRCAGKASSDYALLLDDANIPSSKRLFMTATPKIFQAHFMKKAGESGVDVVSMNDEVLFGPVLHRLTFGEAIKNDLLSDYRVVVVGVDQLFYKDMIDNRRLVETDTDIQSDAQSLASHIGLAKAVKDYDLRRVITFHSRVKAAKDFANNLSKVIEWMPLASRPSREVIASHVAGDMPTSRRNQNLQALGDVKDSQRYVLANARCLSEGVDVPALDGIAFIDPRQSEIDIVQAVGRAIRLSDGKESGTIVIPVFIAESDDVDEVLNSSPFKAVWGVVNALRSHDEQLGEELDYLRTQLGKRGTVGKPEKIIFDLPTKISQSFEKALETRLVETTTASWEFWFGLLESYKEEYGDCLVVQRSDYSGFKLGHWVSMQRLKKVKGELARSRVQRLDELGFVWDAIGEPWEIGFAALKSYKEEHGDCWVNKRSHYNGFSLGRWVVSQRAEKVNGTLMPEEIRRLDELGFVWDAVQAAWERGFAALKSYKEEHGDCWVVRGTKHNGFNLDAWIRNQRTAKNAGLLAADRMQRLDDIGIVWNMVTALWEKRFASLQAYKEMHGDCNVVTGSKHDYTELGNWVAHQRAAKSKGELTVEKVNRLEELGFVWNPLGIKWEQGFSALQAYKQANGDCLVPLFYKTADGFALGSWISSQRRKKELPSSDRKQRLEAIGFVWRVKK
ncbi:Helicase associated domain protein [Gammaproteobacteria bacterium]|nr:Helicase associated domain protein [Gammaproteobacteria bacterium]